MRPIKTLGLFLIVLIFAVSCGRETETLNESSNENNSVKYQEYKFTINPDQIWVDTGIEIKEKMKITIKASDETLALGDPIARRFDPVKMYGHGGLIGKIGEDGVPFRIGVEKSIQGSSDKVGEDLFLGRNITVMMPSGTTDAIMQAYQPATDVTEVESDSQILKYLQPLNVDVTISETDAPAPLSPINNFWLEDNAPTFDWDDIDNAIQYIFEVSEFPDFRSLYLSVNVSNSSVNTATVNNAASLYPNPNNQQQQVFVEGVYYWRVRAQLNTGRTLSPEFHWSDRSVVSTFGIEQQTAITPPKIINPVNKEFAEGEKVLIEFTAPRDGSGLLWKLKLYHAECGKVINTNEISPGLVTFWRVFQKTLEADRTNVPPQNYAYYFTEGLERGEWLIRIILRDGDDDKAERTSSSDISVTVGCNR